MSGVPWPRCGALSSAVPTPRVRCSRECYMGTSALERWKVSFEVFKRSPQPLKAGIVATAEFRRFLESSMYSQRCISASSVVACSACDLFRPTASPYLSPCTLATPKRSNNS